MATTTDCVAALGDLLNYLLRTLHELGVSVAKDSESYHQRQRDMWAKFAETGGPAFGFDNGPLTLEAVNSRLPQHGGEFDRVRDEAVAASYIAPNGDRLAAKIETVDSLHGQLLQAALDASADGLRRIDGTVVYKFDKAVEAIAKEHSARRTAARTIGPKTTKRNPSDSGSTARRAGLSLDDATKEFQRLRLQAENRGKLLEFLGKSTREMAKLVGTSNGTMGKVKPWKDDLASQGRARRGAGRNRPENAPEGLFDEIADRRASTPDEICQADEMLRSGELLRLVREQKRDQASDDAMAKRATDKTLDW